MLRLIYIIIIIGDTMIIRHKDLVNKGYSAYQIKKLVEENKLYFVKKGVYSTDKNINYFEVIAKKHPNAIYTLETAAYIYKLKKKLPSIYYVASKQKDRKMKEEYIKQVFMTDDLYHVGVNNMTYMNVNMKAYDLERLLIEIVRNKTNIDNDSYKEIINNYSKIAQLLNRRKLEEYLPHFKNPKILERINKEVFKIQ